MKKDRWLIRGATVVNDGQAQVSDVLIDAGRIVAVGLGLDDTGAQVIDAGGLHLFPGLIDDQVHFREPGMKHKATIATESAAAVAGGVTSYLEMPNTEPPAVTAKQIKHKLSIAKKDSMANYGFYLGANGTNEDEITNSGTDICGIKVFLGSSTGSLLVDDQQALENVFAAVPANMVLAAHCEDAARIRAREQNILADLRPDYTMEIHALIRDRTACLNSTQRAIDLAKRHNTRLHVLHISTADELKLFEARDLAAKRITAEACIHHLWFCDADYAKLGGRIKCNPAIKTAADRGALRRALHSGRIDVIATDHAPHLLAEKKGDYRAVAAGLPLVGHSLLVLLELVRQGALAFVDVARLGAHNPARLFNIADRGYLRAGQYADAVLVDTDATTYVADATVKYKCGWSPFAGVKFGSQIKAVWVSGQLAWRDGRYDDNVRGGQLSFAR